MFHRSWVNEAFCGTAVEQCLLVDPPLSGSEHERNINCFIVRTIHRITSYSPNERCCIQASRKPVSAPRSWSLQTNASLSSSVNFMARCAKTSGSQWYARGSTSDSVSSSISVVRLVAGFGKALSRFLFVGHAQAKWPCLPHSKHRPVLRYSSFSLLVFAFRAAAEVSIAFGSRGGRR